MSLIIQHVFAPAPLTTRGKPVFLGGDAKSNNLVYATNNAIVIRNVENLRSGDLYYEHPCQPTVAKYSPSGFYIASGDVQGNIRIWDTTQKEHPLKFEFRALSGAISDLAWNNENNRIIAAGDGKEKFGVVFMWDAGSTVGEITGHAKCLASCDYKPTRPYRVTTCGEDMAVNYFEGPPFKFKSSYKGHSRFVNCVRFSPDGNKFVSCSSDKKICVFDGKTGEKVAEAEAHKGGVYGVAWSPDSSKFFTASGDKTCIVWDAATVKPLRTITFGSALEQQQLGCLWLGAYPMTVNLAGDITLLDAALEKPAKVLFGHNKYISALTFHDGSVYTASYDARILEWSYATGENRGFEGKGHSNQVMQMRVDTRDAAGAKLVSCGMDDAVVITPLASRQYGPSIAVEAPCTGIAFAGKDAIIVSTVKSVVVLHAGAVASTLKAEAWCPACVSVNSASGEIAVGGKDDKTVHFYELDASYNLKQKSTLPLTGAITVVEYSPDGKWLATADTSRNIFVYDAATKQRSIEGWIFHNAKVTCLSWSADSKYLLSGGLDSSAYVWNLEAQSKRLYVKTAHFGGVTACCWLNAETVATTGMDCALKTWTVTH
eukprot:TRINITY_DN6102_c0_g1_i1.p1 TRINITY_DN6102_c0_g1~~TRINITY_DN6102_c0_g1_i1.p1  ORF type:complete len:601 (-),score=195.13 TRINITY_DN6102_c0_g1_i1:159-1961(-)